MISSLRAVPGRTLFKGHLLTYKNRQGTVMAVKVLAVKVLAG